MLCKYSASSSNRSQFIHLQCAQIVGHLKIVDLAVCVCADKDKSMGQSQPTTTAASGLLKQASSRNTSKQVMQHQHSM